MNAVEVKALIDSVGNTATMSHTASVYSSTTGKTTDTTTTKVLKAIPPYPYDIKFMDGDIIRATDMQSGIAALDYTPVINDKLTFGSDVYTILNVTPVGMLDTLFVYLLQLRK